MRLIATDLSQAVCQVSTDGHSFSDQGCRVSLGPLCFLVNTPAHAVSRSSAPQSVTVPETAAMAARDRATPREASTPDWSIPLPSLACRTATAWLSPSHWSAQAQPEAHATRHVKGKNCDTRGTAPIADASPLHAYTTC